MFHILRGPTRRIPLLDISVYPDGKATVAKSLNLSSLAGSNGIAHTYAAICRAVHPCKTWTILQRGLLGIFLQGCIFRRIVQ